MKLYSQECNEEVQMAERVPEMATTLTVCIAVAVGAMVALRYWRRRKADMGRKETESLGHESNGC